VIAPKKMQEEYKGSPFYHSKHTLRGRLLPARFPTSVVHRAKDAQSCAAQKGATPPKRKVSEQSKDAACEQQNAPCKCSNDDVATKKQVRSRYARRIPPKSKMCSTARNHLLAVEQISYASRYTRSRKQRSFCATSEVH
jgi:hypothetical protein